MAVSVSNLVTYPQLSGLLFYNGLKKLDNALGLFRWLTGYKPGQAHYRNYEDTTNPSDLCTAISGTSAFTETLVDIHAWKNDGSLCIDETFLSKFPDYPSLRIGAGGDTLGALEQPIMEEFLGRAYRTTRDNIYRGQISGGTAPLNRLNGLVSQSSAFNTATIASTDTILEAIQKVVKAFDVNDYDKFTGPYIVLGGEDAGVALNFALEGNPARVLRNGESFNGRTGSVAIPGGAGVSFVPTAGLNGTNKLICVPADNIGIFTQGEGQMTDTFLGYSGKDDLLYWRHKIVLGVTYFNAEAGSVGTLVAANYTNASGALVKQV